ncbi:MAG TPA: efflux RND transporter periplasmic adaptor subunit [Candidatus Eisenbacteria bacterium]|nr:efflux RND transporter periplasmic adaptor subunit [Candidatus Eisenbacteria bacterium]
MKRTKRALLGLAAPILLALLAALLAGCGGRHEKAAGDGGAPVSVAVLVVNPGTMEGELILPGRVEAREEVTLASRVAGRVTSLPVAAGGSFREGTTLVRFDAPEAREGLAAAEASWSAAKATLDLARRQEARFESLYVSKVAALHELELVRADRERAEAAERGAAAVASERRASVEIGAPFAGVVVRRRVDPGAEVSPGAPLLDIRSRDFGLVVAAVPEQASAALAGPAAVQVGDGAWRAAKLVSADGMIDPLSRTRTARFRPVDGKPLEAGAFARVRLGAAPGGGARAGAAASGMDWLIPSRALVTRGALSGVYVLRGGRASLRWLRLGRQAGDNVVVLAGLDPGDSVALDPTGLVDGRRAEAAR